MTSSSRLWARWVVGGLLSAALVASCGQKDDKDKTRPSYPGDDDVAGAGTKSDHAGSSSTAGGDGATEGGTATAGKNAGRGGALGLAGESEGGAGSGLAGSDEGPGAGGELGTGGKPPETSYEDVGRGTTGPLVFQITSTQSPAIVGQALNYAITIGNTSDLAVDAVNILVRLPVGMNLAYAADAIPDTATGCGNYVCDPNEEATWSLGTLPAHSTQTIWFRGNILNTVGDGDAVAPLFRLNAKDLDVLNITRSTPVQASAPAELTLTADADPVVPGQLVELSLDVGQTGATPLTGAKLHVELPGALAAKTVSDDGSVTSDGVDWTLGNIPVGASFHRTLWVKVHSRATPGDLLNPRATLTFDGGLAVDNVAQVPLSVVAKPEPLSLTVSQLNGPAAPGGQVVYQMTVANSALRAVDGIALTLQIPPEVSFAYAQDAEPNPDNGCTNYVCAAHEEAPWTIGTLEAGTSQTVTLVATVPANAAGSGTLITTPFTLRAPGVNPINILKTVPVYAKSAGQLILGTEVSPVTPGQTFTYDLDVGQVGAKALADAKLTAFMPAGVTVKSVSDDGSDDGGVVTWALGTVGVAETRHRSVEVTLTSEAVAGSTVFARARLTHTDGLELDAQSEYPISVVAEPLALSVTLAATPAIGVPGKQVLYTTTIKNNAARAVDGVGLMLRTGDFSFGYAADADPDTSNGCTNYVCGFGEEAPWNLGSLKAGGSSLVTVNTTVLASLTGGSLLVSRQILTATDLGGTIFLQKTVPTKTP